MCMCLHTLKVCVKANGNEYVVLYDAQTGQKLIMSKIQKVQQLDDISVQSLKSEILLSK